MGLFPVYRRSGSHRRGSSGVSFDTFIAKRITEPLKLTDTGFWVEGADRQKRIAEPQVNPATCMAHCEKQFSDISSFSQFHCIPIS